MSQAVVINGVPAAVSGAFTDAAGTHHPAAVLTLWSVSDLASIGVYPIQDAGVPPGKISVGSSLVWTGSGVVREHQLQNALPLVVSPPTASLAALVTCNIDVNGELTTVENAANLGVAFLFDTGLIYIAFAAPLAGDYVAITGYQDASPLIVRVVEQAADYLMVSAIDLAGNPANPAQVSVVVSRAS